MTREILFRAKRIDNGEWIEGNLLHSDDAFALYEDLIIPTEDANIWSNSAENQLGIELFFKVDSDTICQYTGLTDMNGTKIFENDIVSVYGEKYTVKWQEEAAKFVVSKDGAQFPFDSYWESDLAVIGNIFGNQAAEDRQNDTNG